MAASMSVFLNVTDIQRSLDFYQKLGFRLDKAYKDDATGDITYADLSYQGAELGLGSIPWNDDPDFQAWVATPLGAGVVVYVTVPDVDRIHENARAIGAVIEFAPTDRPYGRLFMLNDPDGYSISFLREPRRAARQTGASKRARKGARKTAKKAAGRKGAKDARSGRSAKKARGAKRARR